jgi:hypothetical protein
MKFSNIFLGWAVLSSLLLSACNKVQFNPAQPEYQDSLVNLPQVSEPIATTPLNPVMPTPPPPSNVTPPAPPSVVPSPMPPQLKAGTCTQQENLNSCLKCELNLPSAPAVSLKAQKLATIMTMVCPIYNKSYPKDYVAPTQQKVWEHILACNPDRYPETTITGKQLETIERLLNVSDDSLRQKMFKGLWYQKDFSDHFELYFGLANSEAAYVFCLDQEISGPLYTSEYWGVHATEQYWTWLSDPEAQKRWNAAQIQRRQLLSCLNKPATQPLPPPQKCEYKMFEGEYAQGGRDFIANMLFFGYKVAVETQYSCMEIKTTPAVNDPSLFGRVKIAGYVCK